MIKETYDYIQKHQMAEQGDGVIVGLSGGADSVCLLHILSRLKHELGIELRAIHVHHGLRGEEADRDAAFSQELCRSLGVPFKLVKIRAGEEARKRRITVEEAGRLARYRIMEAEAKEWEEKLGGGDPQTRIKIATAHHGNDSAETILHNLVRGSGLKGLSGIMPVRGRIIRPVLWAGRDEILAWLLANRLEYVEDSTNCENDYTRNKFRNEILPLITSEINKKAVENILRAGELICDADQYLDKKAEEWIKCHCGRNQVCFSAPELQKEDRIIRSYVVRRMLQKMGCPLKDITSAHIESVDKLLGKQTGKEADLPYGVSVRNEYGTIKFSRRRERKSDPEQTNPEAEPAKPMVFQIIPFRNQEKIPKNQYTKWFDYDKIQDTLSVRNRRTGDYITLKSGGRKTVKAFMIDEKIPREKRDKILLLAEGSHVLWIVGYRISEYYKVTERTKNILQVQLDGGTDSGR